jgi:hypothetical protein
VQGCTSILRRRGVAVGVAGGSRLSELQSIRSGFPSEAQEEAVMAMRKKAKKKAPAKKKAAKKKK